MKDRIRKRTIRLVRNSHGYQRRGAHTNPLTGPTLPPSSSCDAPNTPHASFTFPLPQLTKLPPHHS